MKENTMHLVCPGCGTTNRIPNERVHDAPVCGRCREILIATEPTNLSDAVLPKFVACTELPVLVEFSAESCDPCKAMAPVFAGVARQMPEVRFAKVDSNAAPGSGALYNVRSIPTLILFINGSEVARMSGSGAVSIVQLTIWLQHHLTRDRRKQTS